MRIQPEKTEQFKEGDGPKKEECAYSDYYDTTIYFCQNPAYWNPTTERKVLSPSGRVKRKDLLHRCRGNYPGFCYKPGG